MTTEEREHCFYWWRGFWDLWLGREFVGWDLDACGPPTLATYILQPPRPRMTAYQDGWDVANDWKHGSPEWAPAPEDFP